ncbi:MAG: FG-GAP-like repeat-containing protein [Acidobacteriota bacterium]
MKPLSRIWLAVAMLGLAAARAGANSYVVTPASAWCGVVNSAGPGDTILFAAGSYPGTCAVTVSGAAGAPVTLRSQSSAPADRAVLAYAGSANNIIDVYGSFLVFRWLTFGPTAAGAGVNPIKLRSSMQGVVIDQNVFQGTDIAVAANSSGSTYQDISVTNNLLTNLQSTGLYFGCHDGVSCHALNILIRGNLIDTVQPGDGVGYGLEIKLNSWATIIENTIYNAQGPGIDVYGSNRGDPASLVERNYVEGSKTDAGINVSGGPAVVRNNILVGNQYNGIWAQDYGGRGLQQNVWIVNNTVLGNQTGGIQVSNWQAGAGNVLAFNAVAPLAGTPAFTPAAPVADAVLGNVSCSPAAACFDQPNTSPWDLWPAAGGPLIGAAGNGLEPWRAANDFLCVARGSAADAGAMQRTSPGAGPQLGGGNARPPCGAPAVRGDFDGNTRVDILWRNGSTGENTIWLMNATNVRSLVALPTIPDPAWQVGGVGDVSGDGMSDIVWRNDATGQNTIWVMNAGTLSAQLPLPAVADSNWKIRAVGDFNGDGKLDLLWRNVSTGQNTVWFLNGSSVIGVAPVPAVSDVNWEIGAAADFDGNGRPDILWRNATTGQNTIWLMNGTSVSSLAPLPPVSDANWRIGGAGDYTSDGLTDILWRNGATGQNTVWKMSGTAVSGAIGIPSVGDLNWKIAGPR